MVSASETPDNAEHQVASEDDREATHPADEHYHRGENGVPMFKAGDHVEVRDAFGKWLRAACLSGIEGTHLDGRKIHDFPVIWVGFPGLPEPERIPWPAEDVRLAPPGVPDERFGLPHG